MSNDNSENRESLDDLFDVDVNGANNEDEFDEPDNSEDLESDSDDEFDDDDQDLNADRIAGGAGKRLNNRSLYIVFGLLGTFLFFMFWVMYDKSQTPEMFGGAEEKKTDNASKLAAQITAGAPNGLIMPQEEKAVQAPVVQPLSNPEPEQKAAQSESVETPQSDNMKLQFPVASDIEKPPTRQLTDEERRIRQLKMQMFEQALFAKTSVPVDGYANVQSQRSSTLSGAGGGVNYQHSDVKEQLAETRAKLARMQSSGGAQDVNRAYQERLSAIRATTGEGGDGDFSVAGGNSVSAAGVASEDRWLLQNNRAAQGLNPIEKPRTPYELKAGGVIPATMISGINSDLPGQIIAQTTQPVYDTATGRHLVIPQGTRLVGMYDSGIAYGQKRVLVVWQRLIFPDGKTLDLGSMPGTDSAGYSGFNDKVNTHFFRTIGSALLMSAVIAGVELSQSDNSSTSSSGSDNQRASDALSEALGQSLGQALAQIIQKNLNVSPTLEIRPGYRFNVFATKDIPFTQPYKSFDY